MRINGLGCLNFVNTVYDFRIGRDLPRKLGRNDRILGAAGLCSKYGLTFDEETYNGQVRDY